MNEPEQTMWMAVLTLAMQDLSGPALYAKPAREIFVESLRAKHLGAGELGDRRPRGKQQ